MEDITSYFAFNNNGFQYYIDLYGVEVDTLKFSDEMTLLKLCQFLEEKCGFEKNKNG